MRRPSIGYAFILLLVAASLALMARSHSLRSDQPIPSSRSFVFTYQVTVDPIAGAQGKLLLWLPLPQHDVYQQIKDLQIDSPVAHTAGRESEYGNSFALLKPTPAQLDSGFHVTVRFVATRFEHKVPLDLAPAKLVAMNSAFTPDLQRYLEPDKLVPLTGVISDLAAQQTAGDTTALAKARHIYDYVISTMRYDKSGEGWGHGDAIWACTSRHGNCTDFHSLFIGMMRASGIPARFEIGFPLPESKTAGDIPSYHCWAEFYLNGVGWIPVDASEAWKNPAKRDYFFGAHDVNRVLFSYGRDLHLSADQHGDPLNYFIYPYAELGGKPFSALLTHFSFRDVSPAPSSTSR